MRRSFILSFLGAVYPCMAAQDSLVLVVNMGDSTASIVSAIRITNGDPGLRLTKVLPVGKEPNEACISPDGKRAYVSNRGDTSVTVINLDGLTVASTISDSGMKNPDGCAVNADGTKLYVAGPAANPFLCSRRPMAANCTRSEPDMSRANCSFRRQHNFAGRSAAHESGRDLAHWQIAAGSGREVR